MSLIANARMYAVAPGAAQAWKRLFAWLAAHSGVDLEAIDHAAPAPLEELWSRSDLGCAFMCGFPFARSQPRPKVVAAPVPSDPRYGGLPVYFTDLVVRADSAFQTLEDTFGKRLGYTVETSHSGFNALRHHLLPFRRDERPKLYAETIGPLVTPRRVIEALLVDEIDVGPLDCFALDLVRRHEPAMAARLRVVATTDAAPIPLLIASPACPDETVARLTASLVAFGVAPECASLRGELCLSGFAPVVPEKYEKTIAWDREAIAAGYAMLG
jgi:ABC-type phosphate/phosphonate transport system substrate-binding protein